MGAHGGHVFRITQNEPTSYPSYTVNGYDYADFNNPETGETEPPDVYCVTCGEMAYGYSLNWGEEDESGNPRIVPDQTAADPGTWQELSHAAVGDRVFIARHDGTEQGQGMPGLWATVLSTSANKYRPEHYVLHPDRGTTFEHTNMDLVLIDKQGGQHG